MGKMVLIGGGENGRPGTNYETREIDKEIINLSGKKCPNYLLIAFGSDIPELYYDVMKKIYKDIFGCNTDLINSSNLADYSCIREKIQWADIIYVGGGNTLKLMKIFRKYKIDRVLIEAYHQNKVLCGLSAGAICWCDYGHSASRIFTSNRFIKVKGIGLLHILLCPHYDVDFGRRESLKSMMKTTYKIPALALDNGAALEIIDEECCIITSLHNAEATKCYWKNNIYIEEKLVKNTFFRLENLYAKET